MEETLTVRLSMKTHQRPPRPKSPRPTPTGTVEVEEGQDTSVILQLVPHKEGESSDVPHTPGPSPPGTMKKWPTQDLSKIEIDKEEPHTK